MSNTVYNAQHYIKFTVDEFTAMIVTSFFAAFVLTFNDWGDKTFDVGAGVRALLLMFMVLLFIILITVWLSKIVAVRFGYTIAYKAHLIGLVVGMLLCVISQGYLPIFLPGGFSFEQPERLRVGKFHGFRKGWETGLIAGTFPLALLLWVLLLNPLYLLTKAPFYLDAIVACCLMAIFACIPVPFFEKKSGAEAAEWFRHLRGASFGLDVFYASSAWYVVLCCTVLFFGALAYLLTVLDVRVGIIVYVVSLLFGLVALWVYSRFFKH